MNDVLSPGNIGLSILSGVLAGAYLTVFHPSLPARRDSFRRSLLQGWYFGFLGSILYVARLAFAAAGGHDDVGRVIGGWTLWFVFTIGLVLGSFSWSRLRQYRGRRRLDP